MEFRWTFKSTSGKTFELDLNQIMTLYAMEKDNDAKAHLRVGGFTFAKDYQFKEDLTVGPVSIPIKKESTDASAYNLSDEILGEIISKLEPEQRAFVDATQAYLSDNMAAKGNEVSLKKYGIRLFKNKNYFPIITSSDYMSKKRETDGDYRKLKDSGFTNARKPEAKNPVVLSDFTEVWGRHVDEMSLYHAYVLPLDDIGRVLNYSDKFVEGGNPKSVSQTISEAYGIAAMEYIDNLIRDVNGGNIKNSTTSFANSLVSKAKKVQTMASLSVAIQQPSSIIRAMAMVAPKYFVGKSVTEKTMDRTWEKIKKYAPIAIIKEKGNLLYETLEKAAEYKHDFMLSLSTILKSTVEFAKENPAFFRLHCALKVSSPESEAGKLYAPFAQTLQKIFLEFFQKSVNEIGNMKGKEELFSRIFLQTVESFSLDIIQGRLEFSEHVCFSIIHSFAYGVVTG